jgi:hypothetical protein
MTRRKSNNKKKNKQIKSKAMRQYNRRKGASR